MHGFEGGAAFEHRPELCEQNVGIHLPTLPRSGDLTCLRQSSLRKRFLRVNDRFAPAIARKLPRMRHSSVEPFHGLTIPLLGSLTRYGSPPHADRQRRSSSESTRRDLAEAAKAIAEIVRVIEQGGWQHALSYRLTELESKQDSLNVR